MKYNDKSERKEKAVQLYLEGKTYSEIAKIIGYSRYYVSTLIREDSRIKNYKNKKVLKLYKKPNYSKITVPINLDFWEKIGISKDASIIENVEISVDEEKKIIIIKKH